MRTKIQRTSFECGPVAIYNALHLLGISPLSYSKIKRQCKTNKTGTNPSDMRRTLKYYTDFKWYKRVPKNPKPGLYVLGYTVLDEGHYCALELLDGGLGVVYNWQNDLSKSHKFMCDSVVSKYWVMSAMLSRDSEIYFIRKFQ